MYNENEAFDRGMGDFVVLMFGAAVITPDETLQVLPYGMPESQREKAAPQEIGDGVNSKYRRLLGGYRDADGRGRHVGE